MFCFYCGAEFPDDALFCNKCGRRQKKEDLTGLPVPPFPALQVGPGQPSGNAPMVQGTPLAGTVPTIQGTPPPDNPLAGQNIASHVIPPGSSPAWNPQAGSNPSQAPSSQPELHLSSRPHTPHPGAPLEHQSYPMPHPPMPGSPDGTRIASDGYDGTLQIWEALTGNLIATYNANTFLFGLSWSPDSKHVVVGGYASTVWVLDASSGNVIYTYDVSATASADVAWPPDSKAVASGDDEGDTTPGNVQVWEAI